MTGFTVLIRFIAVFAIVALSLSKTSPIPQPRLHIMDTVSPLLWLSFIGNSNSSDWCVSTPGFKLFVKIHRLAIGWNIPPAYTRCHLGGASKTFGAAKNPRCSYVARSSHENMARVVMFRVHAEIPFSVSPLTAISFSIMRGVKSS